MTAPHPSAIAEREAIVRLLREQVIEERKFNTRPLWRRYQMASRANTIGLSRISVLLAVLASPWMAAAKDCAANWIERGDHDNNEVQ